MSVSAGEAAEFCDVERCCGSEGSAAIVYVVIFPLALLDNWYLVFWFLEIEANVLGAMRVCLRR